MTHHTISGRSTMELLIFVYEVTFCWNVLFLTEYREYAVAVSGSIDHSKTNQVHSMWWRMV